MSGYTSNIFALGGEHVQTDYYISHTLCAEPQCDVNIFWEDKGSLDAGASFKIESCTCVCRTMCCTTHEAAEFVCPICEESSEDELEPEPKKRGREEELEKQVRKLKQRVEELQKINK